MVVIFLALGPIASRIPLASLGALILVIAYGLFDARAFARVRRTSGADTAVFAATFFATLVLPLSYAVFAGVLVNLSLYLQRSSQLQLVELVEGRDGFAEQPLRADGSARGPAVRVVQLEGNLFFGVADALDDAFAALRRSGTRVAVLRLKRTHSVDTTVLTALERFALDMRRAGGHVLLCGVRPELSRHLREFGLFEALGEGAVFETQPGVFASARAALARARELVGR